MSIKWICHLNIIRLLYYFGSGIFPSLFFTRYGLNKDSKDLRSLFFLTSTILGSRTLVEENPYDQTFYPFVGRLCREVPHK